MAEDQLGVGHVHLTAVGLDVDGGHQPGHNGRPADPSRVRGAPLRRPRGAAGYGSLEASLLHCPRCRQAMPVRKRLLLVLMDGEKHEYVCQQCGTPCASKMERLPKLMG